jgi:hypothetical protein
VKFVHLSGDRLYTYADETLYVYSMSNLTTPIEAQQRRDKCYSGMIIDDHLYLGGANKLHVFSVASSPNEPPLIPVTVINTKGLVYKILRVGNELLLG